MRRRRYLIAALLLILAIAALILLWPRPAPPLPQPEMTVLPPTPSPTVPPTPAVTQTPEPTPSPAPTQTATPKPKVRGPFELPIQGATGYTTVSMRMRSAPSLEGRVLKQLPPGAAFRITGEESGYFKVVEGGDTGYVSQSHCMINLPDVLPSIVYDNTNTYSAKMVSSGKKLPGITGKKLYNGLYYNPRLEKDEFIMPVLYATAKKIAAAQKAAMKDGNALKIYEAYRPRRVQLAVAASMDALSKEDAQVRKGIDSGGWRVSWFISQGISHHQRGCAIDTSLVKVRKWRERTIGGYSVKTPESYTEYTMPTPMHELSIAAVTFDAPVSSTSTTAWRDVKPAKHMNKPALLLQRYAADAGLTPLASEWWHFNDLGAYAKIKNSAGRGEFTLTKVLSRSP